MFESIKDSHEKSEAQRLRRRLEKGDCSLNTDVRHNRDTGVYLVRLMDKYGERPIEDFCFKSEDIANAAIDGVKDLIGGPALDDDSSE
jgi:hypothetical protein